MILIEYIGICANKRSSFVGRIFIKGLALLGAFL